VALRDASKLPQYMIPNCKTKLNNHLKELLTYQSEGRMTNELIKDCVSVVWNRRLEVLLKKQGIMVLGAFKVHLTPEIKATITSSSINTDFVMNSGEMTHNCQYYMLQ